jgi:CMP/dCMP kinase
MPVITISRQFGSGGSDIAAILARSLGWSLLDNALVDEVAARLGTTPDEVEAREERVPSLVQRLADAMALGSPEMLPPLDEATLPPSEERLLEMTRRVITEAVARGPLVLVGRGAQSMLAQRTDALHVFCYAPHDVLVARAAERLGVSPHEAERTVNNTNKQRENFVRKYWHRSWSAVDNYHLCLNTGWLGIEGAAELVLQAARSRFTTQTV